MVIGWLTMFIGVDLAAFHHHDAVVLSMGSYLQTIMGNQSPQC